MSPGWTPEKSGAPGEIRTPDPLVRSQMLYPAELRARAAILPKFGGGASADKIAIAGERKKLGRRAEQTLAARARYGVVKEGNGRLEEGCGKIGGPG
jgi:hypothetical protein